MYRRHYLFALSNKQTPQEIPLFQAGAIKAQRNNQLAEWLAAEAEPLPPGLRVMLREASHRAIYMRGANGSLLRGFHVILLQLAVQRGLSNSQNSRGRQLVPGGLAQGAQDCAALQFLEWQ